MDTSRPPTRGEHGGQKGNTASVTVSTAPDGTVAPRLRPNNGVPNTLSNRIRKWTPTAFVVSYFVFSIALYAFTNQYATKVFWFLYLTIATLVAGTTAFEAYDGLTPLSDARKALARTEQNDWKFSTPEEDLPEVELVFDDAEEGEVDSQDWQRRAEALRKSMNYPQHKLRVTVLCKTSRPSVSVTEQQESGIRWIWIPHNVASRVVRFQALFDSSTSTQAPVTAIFSGVSCPHPYALRFAVGRLVQNTKLDIIQGRTVLAASSSKSLVSSLASLQHDLTSALLNPGRSSTWGVGAANGYGSVWRTSALQTAFESLPANTRGGAEDLSYAAYALGSKTIHDLSVTTYVPAPNGLFAYFRTQATKARRLAGITIAWTKLAFTRAPKENAAARRTFQARMGVLYALPVQILTAHAIAQYFSLALALLLTRTPHSTAEFAQRLYWPHPVSQWFIIMGAICLVATVGMAYKARSESVSVWTLPAAILLYPLVLAVWAVVGIYGQVGFFAELCG